MSGTVTFDFTLSYQGEYQNAPMPTAIGEFSFSNTLLGQTISAAELSSFSIDFVSGPYSEPDETYNTLGSPTSSQDADTYFEFDSANDQFLANTNGEIIVGSSPEPYDTNDLFYLTPNSGYQSIVIVHQMEHGTYAEYGNFATVNVAQEPACFTLGTCIGTPCGNIPVEELAVGDVLVTASGEQHSVSWIGKRSYEGRFLAANPRLKPILFRIGSLGDGLPRRDLRVSPKHAMFLDDVLVSAECLVNGTTIVRDHACERVDYFHIEIDHHDVLLAEGVPSESFVDDNSRDIFQNAAEWQALNPGQERLPAVYCAPRVESGFRLESIRRRLALVAEEVALAA